jgi:eukaryotic-like serine/threonine-protein kinase
MAGVSYSSEGGSLVLGESTARIGRAAPGFTLECADGRTGVRRTIRLSDYSGSWLALLFYPRDFSFVCPTELALFSARYSDFVQRNCDLLGISVDPVELHLEWLNTSASEGGVRSLLFPLASDPDGATSQAYGVWVEDKQYPTVGSS